MVMNVDDATHDHDHDTDTPMSEGGGEEEAKSDSPKKPRKKLKQGAPSQIKSKSKPKPKPKPAKVVALIPEAAGMADLKVRAVDWLLPVGTDACGLGTRCSHRSTAC